jgi:peptidoglycan/xylan/chitin deacetylase (PgdA/CDA1 family)
MSVLDGLLRAGAAVVAPGGARGRLFILIYHRVLPKPDPLTGEVDAASFDGQMGALRDCFNVLPLDDAIERLSTDRLPPRAAAITFDDGYADNLHVALPILRKYGLHATFFIATGYLEGGRMFNDTVIEALRRMPGPSFDLPAAGLQAVRAGSLEEKRESLGTVLRAVKHLPPGQRAEAAKQMESACGALLPDDLMMTFDELRALVGAGAGIGGHTVTHPILTRVSLEQAREEVERNRRDLATLVGRRIDLFAYPNGVPDQDYGYQHVALARDAGYRAALTTSWGAASPRSDRFQLPRFTPWDREPRRFVMRLLHNGLRRRAVEVRAHVAVA